MAKPTFRAKIETLLRDNMTLSTDELTKILGCARSTAESYHAIVLRKLRREKSIPDPDANKPTDKRKRLSYRMSAVEQTQVFTVLEAMPTGTMFTLTELGERHQKAFELKTPLSGSQLANYLKGGRFAIVTSHGDHKKASEWIRVDKDHHQRVKQAKVDDNNLTAPAPRAPQPQKAYANTGACSTNIGSSAGYSPLTCRECHCTMPLDGLTCSACLRREEPKIAAAKICGTNFQVQGTAREVAYALLAWADRHEQS